MIFHHKSKLMLVPSTQVKSMDEGNRVIAEDVDWALTQKGHRGWEKC